MFLILSGIGLLWSIGCFICLIMSLIGGILTKGEFMDTARIYGKFLLVGLLVTVLGASVFHGIDSKAYEETKTTSINGIVPLKKGTEIEGKILDNETYVSLSKILPSISVPFFNGTIPFIDVVLVSSYALESMP